jgi:hypothetical protein
MLDHLDNVINIKISKNLLPVHLNFRHLGTIIDNFHAKK